MRGWLLWLEGRGGFFTLDALLKCRYWTGFIEDIHLLQSNGGDHVHVFLGIVRCSEELSHCSNLVKSVRASSIVYFLVEGSNIKSPNLNFLDSLSLRGAIRMADIVFFSNT